MMRSALWLGGCLLLPAVCGATSTGDELLQMDLTELMQVKLDGAATLTPTATRRMPASITSIDRQMIEQSGARSLFDLLEIYVPNFHYLPHHWEAPHMGMRGLIGDRDPLLVAEEAAADRGRLEGSFGCAA